MGLRDGSFGLSCVDCGLWIVDCVLLLLRSRLLFCEKT
jgi:hypothetical protein